MDRARRGVNTLIPGLVITALLMIVTALLVARILNDIALAVEQSVEYQRTPYYTMRITGANYAEVYGGPSLEIELVNEGSEVIRDLGALEVVVSYEIAGARTVEILRFKREANTWIPGHWVIVRVVVGSISYTYEAHPYLRPGERALITAYLSREPHEGTLISVAVITPEAVKAEFSLVR